MDKLKNLLNWFRGFLFRFQTVNELTIISDEVSSISNEVELPSLTRNKYSLHLGLNYVDKDVYDGWDGKLRGCVNDANLFKDYCTVNNYATYSLINEEVTYSNVVGKISLIASKLKPNDEVVITYSGHGGQVYDKDGDELDERDETLCFYDGQVNDDTVKSLFGRFPKDVNVIFISDSCHSQTNLRNIPDPDYTVRSKPDWVESQILKIKSREIECNLIALTGCKDSEFSYDLKDNGNFTKCLFKVLNENTLLSWKQLLEKTSKLANTIKTPQTPQLTVYTKDISNLKAF